MESWRSELGFVQLQTHRVTVCLSVAQGRVCRESFNIKLARFHPQTETDSLGWAPNSPFYHLARKI